jgi:hypothetical protein
MTKESREEIREKTLRRLTTGKKSPELDEYEEGTFTPTVDGLPFPAITTNFSGRYVRKGNVVHISITTTYTLDETNDQ